jgi:hypothetical protein
MANPFSDLVGFMSAAGIFNYLALFLVLVVLYYLFLHLIGKHVKSPFLKKGKRQKYLSAILSVLVTAFLYVAFLPAAGGTAMFLIAFVFVAAFVFILFVLTGKLAGIDIPELMGMKDKK